jgi:uncharacterized protein (DUF952 family)
VSGVAQGEPLFHLISRVDWEEARAQGEVRPPSLVVQGFVHLSTRAQVLGTANRFFRGRGDILVLCLDPARLGAAVRFEEGEPGQLFPHLYGPLPVAAVTSAEPLVPDAAGVFVSL